MTVINNDRPVIDHTRPVIDHGARKEDEFIYAEPRAQMFVAEVHDRMPVLLAEQNYEPWLSGAAGTELLRPADEDLLQRWPVSKRVNSSRAPDDDPTLIEKITLASHPN